MHTTASVPALGRRSAAVRGRLAPAPFTDFNLTLCVTSHCNLRCSYCYASTAHPARLPEALATAAIDRALASLRPGGRLNLSFFGGEPLLEPELILRLASYARAAAARARLDLQLALTTNGTRATGTAWEALTAPGMAVAVSFDAPAKTHDTHRRTRSGRGTAHRAVDTLRRLASTGHPFRVVRVVRPDSLESLTSGLRAIRDLGAAGVDLTLDVWTVWTDRDRDALARAIDAAASVWKEALPGFGVSWFDDALARMARLPVCGVRCGFGLGEIAVAPSGRLYPCERLIGDDSAANPMALPGRADDGTDFLNARRPSGLTLTPCGESSAAQPICRCADYVRTGDPSCSDDLLRLLAAATWTATAHVIRELRSGR